jgi:DNA-binding CsgD family transcriptional regulator
MKDATAVGIIIGSRFLASAVRHFLENGPTAFRCRILPVEDLAGPFDAADLDVLLIVPQHWKEMACWLPILRKEFTCRRWLILADVPLVGMFLSDLESYRCSLITPRSSTDDVGTALLALATPYPLCLTDALRVLFSSTASALLGARQLPLPTRMELECACALSLGLRDRQIAEARHIDPKTVRDHLRHLRRKLGVVDREELVTLVQKALASSFPPERMGEDSPQYRRRKEFPRLRTLT